MLQKILGYRLVTVNDLPFVDTSMLYSKRKFCSTLIGIFRQTQIQAFYEPYELQQTELLLNIYWIFQLKQNTSLIRTICAAANRTLQHLLDFVNATKCKHCTGHLTWLLCLQHFVFEHFYNWYFIPFQVKVWFQNRRTKHKRVQAEDDLTSPYQKPTREAGNSLPSLEDVIIDSWRHGFC